MLSKLCAPYFMCPHSNNSHFSFKKVLVLTRSQIYTYIYCKLQICIVCMINNKGKSILVNRNSAVIVTAINLPCINVTSFVSHVT